MEEIIIIIIQFIFEGLGQAILEIFGEWAIDSTSEKTSTRLLVGLAAICFGVVIGFITIKIFPHSLIHSPGLRCLNLLVAPFMAYWLSKLVSKILHRPATTNKLLFAVMFTFSLVAFRLAYVAQ